MASAPQTIYFKLKYDTINHSFFDAIQSLPTLMSKSIDQFFISKYHEDYIINREDAELCDVSEFKVIQPIVSDTPSPFVLYGDYLEVRMYVGNMITDRSSTLLRKTTSFLNSLFPISEDNRYETTIQTCFEIKPDKLINSKIKLYDDSGVFNMSIKNTGKKSYITLNNYSAWNFIALYNIFKKLEMKS